MVDPALYDDANMELTEDEAEAPCHHPPCEQARRRLGPLQLMHDKVVTDFKHVNNKALLLEGDVRATEKNHVGVVRAMEKKQLRVVRRLAKSHKAELKLQKQEFNEQSDFTYRTNELQKQQAAQLHADAMQLHADAMQLAAQVHADAMRQADLQHNNDLLMLQQQWKTESRLRSSIKARESSLLLDFQTDFRDTRKANNLLIHQSLISNGAEPAGTFPAGHFADPADSESDEILIDP